MRTALYYPHTSVQSDEIIKTALLLWDRLEYIVPRSSWTAHYSGGARAKAMELIGSARKPTAAEMKEAHGLIEDLATSELPRQFYFTEQRRRRRYEVYPEKLMPETWDMLRRLGLARHVTHNSDYMMSQFGGLVVMSLLADCCAGITRARVTDRAAAYEAVARCLGSQWGSKGRARIGSQQLVQTSLQILDVRHIPIERLIFLREREDRERGHTLRDLRHRYRTHLEQYVELMTRTEGTAADAIEIRRQFKQDAKDDLASLKQELGFAKRDALLSKEMFVTTLAGIGTVALAAGLAVPMLGALTFAGAPTALLGGVAVANRYLSSRRVVMQKHPMAYLYAAQTI